MCIAQLLFSLIGQIEGGSGEEGQGEGGNQLIMSNTVHTVQFSTAHFWSEKD